MDTNEPNSESAPEPNEHSNAEHETASTVTPASAEPLHPVGFQFTGQAGEFFKIWIVNLLLQVVTLGFYWPWAMVRTKRYFYANTHLDGHSFDYLAKPKSLLIGYLIVLCFAALYAVVGLFNPLFVFPVILVYLVAAPWIIYKALRFRARNTAYRNVRFKFSGLLSDSYITCMAWAVLVPFTFGLIIPYWKLKQHEYFFGNLQFGKTPFGFKPKGAEYYKYYLLFFAIGMAIYFAVIILFVAIGAASGYSMDAMGSDEMETAMTIGLVIGMAIVYAIIIAAGVIFQNGLWMLIFNYNMSVWNLGDFRFESKMKLVEYILLCLGNIFASVFTLGLLIPWAKIRLAKYKLENMYLLAPGGQLGEHFEASHEEEGALGEAATDFMDFDIGL